MRLATSVLGLGLALFSIACGGGGSGSALQPSAPATVAAGTGGHALKANACDYLSTTDFQQALGLSLTGSSGSANSGSCSFRDPGGDTCNLTLNAGSAAAANFASYKSAAARYGPVDSFAVGDQGFFSAELQNPPDVWFFDFGLTKNGTFADMICGATFGSDNPRPKALALAERLAKQL